ncbi:hypothetical protein WISP_83392 [Willisornis vidua]|uniref:Uncharacterized protein n=1 Tax=Willisornis vidua TaxID=1566151 RepID=A0ABQ9D3Z3_9PASS|nr:hypothetical protein WISP_83392 [Willisornis vidua]
MISAREAESHHPSGVSAEEKARAQLRAATAVSRIIALHSFCTVNTITADFKGNQIQQVPKKENNKRHQGRQIPLEITGDYPGKDKKIQCKLDIKCNNSSKIPFYGKSEA